MYSAGRVIYPCGAGLDGMLMDMIGMGWRRGGGEEEGNVGGMWIEREVNDRAPGTESPSRPSRENHLQTKSKKKYINETSNLSTVYKRIDRSRISKLEGAKGIQGREADPK